MPPAYVKLPSTAQDRCCRRRGYLRGSHQGTHAVSSRPRPRAAELPDAPSDAPSLHPPTDRGYQCDPRQLVRVRDRRWRSGSMVSRTARVVADPRDKRVPEIARAVLPLLGASSECSRRRSWSSTGSDHRLAPSNRRRARRLMHSWCLSRRSPHLLVASVPIRRLSDQGGISRLDWARAEQHSSGSAKTSSAAQQHGDR